MPATQPLMNTYARQPVAFTHGEGAWLYDTAGRRYLDCLAGIAVNTLGHNHPKLVAALREQVARLIHSSNLFEVPLQTELGARLVELSGMTNVFFCNSGLEANEAALKIARKYGHERGVARPEVVVYEHAFHGRSIATLSATGNEKVQKGFEPLVEGFVRVPLNDLAALERVAAERPDVVAVFLEAIQGEGGIQPARIEYLRAVRELCDRKGWLMMVDEVQCGTGRTGKWFAHQWAGVVPDVMPLAKGLASGVPIGAVVARGAAAEVFEPGNHGTTFGGNPLAMRAGLVTIATMQEEGLVENAARIGQSIMSELGRELAGAPGFVEVRGQGLMIGVELDRPCGALVRHALDAGLVLNVTADRVVRLLPPLVFRAEHAEQLVGTLVPLIRGFLQDNQATATRAAGRP
ncbi:MAG: aspartate aminotransferase family protein [Lautropia sp.]|nr:MAG: aspartate aminotransferase family protein [Pseudomonadota bacterium]MBC6958353.1 aspartate aminotransferase family protein [Lautropia sp.]MCL4701402.1 aspartate aminotransferase family protein [Burkholderiaceae bacterium]MCZ2412968.1 aspartate aminotransferase family protein [Burkholderiales bacterium]MDL1907201.1 aspartate aminotransferase family protein [Betaproteobacteria bacterium PRO1]